MHLMISMSHHNAVDVNNIDSHGLAIKHDLIFNERVRGISKGSS